MGGRLRGAGGKECRELERRKERREGVAAQLGLAPKPPPPALAGFGERKRGRKLRLPEPCPVLQLWLCAGPLQPLPSHVAAGEVEVCVL